MTQPNPGCIPACLITADPAEIDFHIHAFNSHHGHDMVLDAPGEGCIVIDGHLLRGGHRVGQGLWQSRDRRWRFCLNEQGDLLVEGLQPELRCHLTVLGWLHRWTSPGRAVGIELEGYARRARVQQAAGGGDERGVLLSQLDGDSGLAEPAA